jgi:hypothetical protein
VTRAFLICQIFGNGASPPSEIWGKENQAPPAQILDAAAPLPINLRVLLEFFFVATRAENLVSWISQREVGTIPAEPAPTTEVNVSWQPYFLFSPDVAPLFPLDPGASWL